MSCGMDGERIARATARIETAARRIERAAARPAAPGDDQELSRKHEALRAGASAALAELDRLIGSLEA